MIARHGAWYDEQTGLPGRSFWDVVLAAESSRCSRWGRSGTVLLVAVAGLEDVIAQWGTEMLDRPMEDLPGEVDMAVSLSQPCWEVEGGTGHLEQKQDGLAEEHSDCK